MAIYTDFVFLAKLVLYFLQVSCKIVRSGAVPDENGIVCLDWFSLLFKSEIRIDRVNNPSTVIGLFGGHTGFLESRDWREAVRAKWLAV
jgi:hypothetical protein